MKKILKLTSTLFVASVLFSSCKKDSSNNNNTTIPAGKSEIKCTYSGAASGTFTSSLSLSTCLKSTSLVNVSGGVLNGTSTSQALIILPLSISTGTHNQTSDNVDGITMSLTINNGTNSWVIGGDGATGFNFNITRSDATGIEGTFSGELGNESDNTKVSITNGSFKGTY